MSHHRKLAKASVFVEGDIPFVVTETPSEVAAIIDAHPHGLIRLTLGNESEWSGKPLYVRANRINAIAPAMVDEYAT